MSEPQIVVVDNPFRGAQEQNLGAEKNLSAGGQVGIMGLNAHSDVGISVYTIGAFYEYIDKPQGTDDLSGLYYKLMFGTGGASEEIEFDANNGVLISPLCGSFRLLAFYDKVPGSPSNPNPTFPTLKVKGMVANGSRPTTAIGPTRTRRFAITGAGPSAVQTVPQGARSFILLGTTAGLNFTFYTDQEGTSPLVTFSGITGQFQQQIPVPQQAQSFTAELTAPGNATLFTIFQLCL